MKHKVVMSAPSKPELEKMINDYFFSQNYVITEDNRVYNKLKDTYIEDYTIVTKKNRWQFCRNEK